MLITGCNLPNPNVRTKGSYMTVCAALDASPRWVWSIRISPGAKIQQEKRRGRSFKIKGKKKKRKPTSSIIPRAHFGWALPTSSIAFLHQTSSFFSLDFSVRSPQTPPPCQSPRSLYFQDPWLWVCLAFFHPLNVPGALFLLFRWIALPRTPLMSSVLAREMPSWFLPWVISSSSW